MNSAGQGAGFAFNGLRLKMTRGWPGEQLGHARTRLGPGNEDTVVIEADASCFDISTTAMDEGWGWGDIEGWGRQML